MSASSQLDLRQFISARGNQPITTSLEVAKAFGKRHDNVLRAIRQLRIDCPSEFWLLNFEERDSLDSRGKSRPVFEMTKDGFTILVFRFDGKRAAEIQVAYINAFNWMAEQLAQAVSPSQAPSTAPAPAAFTSPEFISLRYNGHPLRVTHMAGGLWYGSHGLARAMGYLTNAKINFGLRGEAQLRVVPHRGKTLAVINHIAMLEVVGRAPAQVAQPFMRWLSVVLPGRFGDAAPALPASVDPLARVTGDSKQLAFDYFAQCRQAVTHAGGSVPAWDSGAEQRIADDMAALLVSNRRWVLTFADGVPVLKAVRDNTVLLRLDDTEQLARLLRDQVPAEALPTMMDAVCRRLVGKP